LWRFYVVIYYEQLMVILIDIKMRFFFVLIIPLGHAVGWGTALQAWRSRGSILDGVIVIYLWHNPPGRTMVQGSPQPLTEMSTRSIYRAVKSWPLRKADNLTIVMWRLSWNLGTWNSRNPQGLSRPVMGLIYL